MDTNRFNEEHAAKSRAVCERIEREDAERRGKLADLMDAQLKSELGRAKAEADGWRKIAERLLKHTDECEAALAKRNERIAELEKQVADLRAELANAKVLDADGVEINVGDTVYAPRMYGDNSFTVSRLTKNRDGRTLVMVEEMGSGLFPETVTNTRPDSWKRLEEDALKGVCEYAGAKRRPGTIDAHTCCGCRFDEDGDGPTCEQQMALDIIRRAKALAGVEVE